MTDDEGEAPTSNHAHRAGGLTNSVVDLKDGGALHLGPDGFQLNRPGKSAASQQHAYTAIRHVYASDRVLLISLDDNVLSVRGADFDIPARGPAFARSALLERVAKQPDGASLLEEMGKVDALGEREEPAWIVWATVALCLVGTGFQFSDPMLERLGAFMPELFARGEYWRAFTSQFLHALTVLPVSIRDWVPFFPFAPIHLFVNVAGFAVLGYLVERPLGSWRMLMVMAMSALGSIGGILLYGHSYVIGASGMVSGLAGAMLAMELHSGGALPAFWRLPRRTFISIIVIQFAVIDQLLSHWLAGGAHLGGFVGGYFAAWLLGRPTLEGIRPTQAIRFGTYCAGVLVVVGLSGILPLATHDMQALERHAMRLYDVSEPQHLYRDDNAAAWMIATGEGASSQGLDLAVALAERAVTNTGGFSPGVIDTLAEALFRRGDPLGAILTIDQAISLAPTEPYYLEQRRRYTGERDPADRPPPPGALPAGVLPPEVDEEVEENDETISEVVVAGNRSQASSIH